MVAATPSYEELAAENAQLRVLVAESRRLNEALAARVAQLEARLGQSPRNSDRPPASEGYEKPAPKSRRKRTGRSSGGQPGHQGRTLSQVAHPDKVITHAPAECSCCGESLASASVTGQEARQVFELPPIRLVVDEHRLQRRRCTCGHVTAAAAPAGVSAPAQYGPRFRAVGTYLLAGHYLPLKRTRQLLGELFGAPVSEGTLDTWNGSAAEALAGFDEVLQAGLIAAPVLGADETGIRVEGSLAWVHAARTDTLTRYTVSARRGYQGMVEAGVLENLSPEAVLVTDCWSPYFKLDVLHALCGAHLGRELVAAAEVAGQKHWAEPLEKLLGEINVSAHRARQAGATELAPEALADYRTRYRELINTGWAANPDHRPGQRGRRGKRKPKHVNLLARLDTRQHEVLRFAEDLRVPYTNNGSEQDVRPLKIRLKIAGSLRTMAGAQAFVRLRSCLSTARKQGQSAVEVMTRLNTGDPWLPAITA